MMHSRQMYVLFHNQCNLLFITLFQKPNNYKNIFYVLELVIVCLYIYLILKGLNKKHFRTTFLTPKCRTVEVGGFLVIYFSLQLCPG